MLFVKVLEIVTVFPHHMTETVYLVPCLGSGVHLSHYWRSCVRLLVFRLTGIVITFHIYPCPVVLLSYCPVVPLPRCLVVPLSRCPVVPLSRCPVVPLSRCPVVLFIYCSAMTNPTRLAPWSIQARHSWPIKLSIPASLGGG